MRVNYDVSSDMAYIYLIEREKVRGAVWKTIGAGGAKGASPTFNLDLDHDGHLIGIEVFNAAARLSPELLMMKSERVEGEPEGSERDGFLDMETFGLTGIQREHATKALGQIGKIVAMHIALYGPEADSALVVALTLSLCVALNTGCPSGHISPMQAAMIITAIERSSEGKPA